MKDECDINVLMKKYEKTGMLDHIVRYKGQYADVTHGMDYQAAIHTIMEADEMFSSLPAAVRDKFDNSPAEFLKFVENPENHDEMAELGLLDRVPTPAPTPEPPAPTPEPTPARRS